MILGRCGFVNCHDPIEHWQPYLIFAGNLFHEHCGYGPGAPSSTMDGMQAPPAQGVIL